MTLTKYKDYNELFNGCVAYYDGSLNSSGQLQDLSGNGYNGSITGATRTGNNRFGFSNKSLYFSNTTDKVDTGISSGMGTGAFTAIAWINSNINTTVLNRVIVNNGYNSITSTMGFQLALVYSSPNFGLYFLISTGSAWTSQAVFSSLLTCYNNWAFVAMTFIPSTNYNLYVNGSNIYTGSIAYTTHANPYTVYIGKDYGRTDSTFSGNIGEVILYNRSLSSYEISLIYKLTSQKYLYPVLQGQRGVY